MALVACGKADSAPSSDTNVAISVVPLAFPVLGDVVYRLTVKRQDGGVVWTRDVGSAAFGDGLGAISYVGPCDPSDGQNPNHVELSIVRLVDVDGATIPTSEWANPAPLDQPLVQDVTCVAGGDAALSWSLTVLRSASQGFFDVAVTFGDIFCSAKFDCRRSDDAPLELLFDPSTEKRGTTAVLAFACTAGNDANGGAEPTWLHLTDATITCDNLPTMYFDPSQGPGQHGELGGGTFFETAIYQVQEQVEGLDKCSWNLALGLNIAAAPKNCRLTAQGSASHLAFGAEGLTPAGAIWPYITWRVNLTNGAGALACGRHALNGGDAVVATGYTPIAGATFQHEWRCGADSVATSARACDGVLASNTTALTYPTPTGVSVAIGGVRSPTYTLPAGRFIGASSECCVNPCCDTATP